MLDVLRPGLLTTVQDSGRAGYRALGVPSGGAADPFSLGVANLLVGNPVGAAALECTLLGPAVRFGAPAVVAVAGARGGLELDGVRVPDLTPVAVRAGQVLTVGPLEGGVRAYLAVRGGLRADAVLGSAATDLRGAFGGHEGRALARGDTLVWSDGPSASGVPRVRVRPDVLPLPADPATLRVVPGPDVVPAGTLEVLLSDGWTLSPASDRMGLRLMGLPLVGEGGSGASEPVVPGTVQLPPGGAPIVLLVDAGTHGGYARPLVVIRADLPLAGQVRPGTRVRFQPVTREQAHAALQRRQRDLRGLEVALKRAWGEHGGTLVP